MRAFLRTIVFSTTALLVAQHAGAGAARPIVVELFTSQGCNTCPPADTLLGRLADRKDVLALSLPVTYWDMLGWRDTLASDDNTRRQKAYAQVMGSGGIYTPQMVIDGVSEVVGNREAAVDAAIGARSADATDIPVNLSWTARELHVSVAGGGEKSVNATVWLFDIAGSTTVAIGGGENAGRTITYRNVVRGIRPIGIWKGPTLSLDLPRDWALGSTRDAVAVIVQQDGYGRVLGAAWLGETKSQSWR